MAPPPPSNPLKGAGGHDAATPQGFPSGCGHKNKNNRRKSKAKKLAKPKHEQDQEVSEVETDATANAQTDLDTDADADADADADVDTAAGPDADEMPKRPPPPPRRDVDISMIINWQQRLQFDALNQAILANIETQATKPFNFLDHPVAKQHRVKIWNFGPAFAAAVQDTQPTSANDSTADAPKASEKGDASTKEDGAQPSAAPRIVIKVDASSVQSTVPSMNLLREEATQYFNKWKATFLKRCNDLIVPKQSISDTGTSRQGQGALRGGGTGAGRGGRYQQEGMLSSCQIDHESRITNQHGKYPGLLDHQMMRRQIPKTSNSAG